MSESPRKPFDAPFAEPMPTGSPRLRRKVTVDKENNLHVTLQNTGTEAKRYPVKDCPHPRAFLEKPGVHTDEPMQVLLQIDIVKCFLFICALYIAFFLYAAY